MAKTICTSKAVYFDFEHPEKHPFDIEEIAHALSLQCRYTGHCAWHYSIAQHSAIMSFKVPAHLAYTALMHDTSEAYLGDVSTHLKSLLPGYKRLEKRVEKALAAHFSFLYPLPATVKEADSRMLMTEVRELLPSHTHSQDWPDAQPYDFGIARMTPEDAKVLFLNRYNELTR